MEVDNSVSQVKQKKSTVVAEKSMEQQPVVDQGQGDGKPKEKRKSVRGRRGKGKPGKIHIRLPTIESYQKEIEFSADAPGRVVVRLERLMGSDKIRPVDGKFMETLIQRLEEEETIAWERKIRLRKKAEKERYRQLAINGLMEPGPGMEDLYNHPVFRVNRILKRLSKIDSSFSGNIGLNLPPIANINPFENDDTGSYFKEYPAHRALRKNCERYKVESSEEEEMEDEIDEPDLVASQSRSPTAVEEEEEDEDEYDEELLELEDNIPELQNVEAEQKQVPDMDEMNHQLDQEYKQSLTKLQNQYGVPKYDGFEDMWKPFRSELVEQIFTDYDDLEGMYDIARDVLDVYVRQGMETDDHVMRAGKGQVASYARSMSVTASEEKPSYASAAAMAAAKKAKEAEDEEEEG